MEVGTYLPLRSEVEAEADAQSSDNSRLKQLGYKQQLRRRLSAISNFAVTFSILSVMTGITTTFSTGLTFGGPATMIYGWLIAGVFTLIVGASMAEICSSYPTSGGLYFWSSKLCGNQWGPFAAWMTGWLRSSSSKGPFCLKQPFNQRKSNINTMIVHDAAKMPRIAPTDNPPPPVSGLK